MDTLPKFLIIQIISADKCLSFKQNLMDIHCEYESHAMNTSVTVQVWSVHLIGCQVASNIVQPVLAIFKMVEYFADELLMSTISLPYSVISLENREQFQCC